MQTVLMAPGVKDAKLVSFTRDDDNDKDAVAGIIRSIVTTSSPAQRSAFHVLDLNRVLDLFSAWRRALPGVRPYYAVKCNPEPAMLGALAALGAGFDCASRAEIDAVLRLGVPPGSIVYANPCKAEAHLEHAAAAGVGLATYDSEEEVAKVRRCHPGCALLLRLRGPDGAEAIHDMGTKFGARADEVAPLLCAAQRAGVAVAGVSFHVGTGASRAGVFREAIAAARAAFDEAAALGMPAMRVLDIGGGFTACAAFDEAAAVLRDALLRYFGDLLTPASSSVELIGEPGRYFAETAFTLAARVIGRRERGEVREYWVEDGVYGSLNCVHMDQYHPRPRPLRLATPGGGGGEKTTATHTSTVFGPTCGSQDRVVTGYQLPEMSVGDWLIFDNMGAYSTAAGSKFNGFDTSEIDIYVAYSNEAAN